MTMTITATATTWTTLIDPRPADRRRLAGAIRAPALALVVLAVMVRPAAAAACADLKALDLPDVRVTVAEARQPGVFTLGDENPGASLDLPSFCRVVAVATPTSDSRIGFEVWLPADAAWNGRLLGTGNGGYSGALGYRAMAAGLREGYVVAGSDTGHTGGDLTFAVGHPAKIDDWGYRAVHVMTEAAKLIVRAGLGRFPHHAYFSGCSTGGHQALSEAQRYPEDYDGILAGAPGHNRVRLNAGFLWSWMALHDAGGASILPAAKIDLLHAAVVAACDPGDGVTDGIIGDPSRCRFDPAAIQCAAADGADCLTPPQVAAVRKVYAGPRNPRTGEPIFAGWPPGSERVGARGGWASYLIDPDEPMRLGFWRYWVFKDSHWDWRTFDWDRDLAYADRAMAAATAVDPDLRPFAARGGRLLMYAGWADPVVPPGDTVDYHATVVRALGGAARAAAAVRLFMAPGMGHCGGGPGPDTFDGLGALVRWVEDGVAPERIVAATMVDGVATRTRPLCPHPRVARYQGQGGTDTAASFVCVLPE